MVTVLDDIHIFEKNGEDYLFLPETVSIFRIDRETADALRSGDASERLRDAETFIARYRESHPAARPMRKPEEITDVVGGFYLFVSQECNLRCGYCYGDGGEYGGKMLMTEETLRNTFRTFFERDGGSYRVVFFGGEPLLNFPLMKKAVQLAKELEEERGIKVVFDITTNGTIFNQEIKKFFNAHISAATISLDGPREINDRQRPALSGFSVHDRVVENIAQLTQDARFSWNIRGIITNKSCNAVAEVFRYLASLGPAGIGLSPVYTEPGNSFHLDESHYREYIRNLVEMNRFALRDILAGNSLVTFDYPFLILYFLAVKRSVLYQCNAGTNLLAVAADGQVYPCHRFVGDSAFAMGNVNDRGLREGARYRSIRAGFTANHVDNRADCKGCWARYLCGGSCSLQSYTEKGDITAAAERHCRYIKAVIEGLLSDVAGIMEDEGLRQQFFSRMREVMTKRGTQINREMPGDGP